MIIQRVTDPAFAQYGRVLTEELTMVELISAMEKTEAPEDNVVYYPSIEELEALPEVKAVQDRLFGGLDLQVGYCNGTNSLLNALEYHRSSEFGVAVTDLILLVGRQQDIGADYTYDTSRVEAFLMKAGEVAELYATTLHYAPCSVDGKPFRNVVILPKGTNTEIEKMAGESEGVLLAARNKWLIAHEEAGIEGAFIGLQGENLRV